MELISQTAGYWFLFAFAIAMVGVTWVFTKRTELQTVEGFLAAGRNVKWWIGGPSIAASWIWAGALFVSTQVAYQQGLPGIFWFTLPNVIAVLIFAILGPRIRKELPEGYTLPQYIEHKLKSARVHYLYVATFFFYQVLAITFNIFAGGALISLMTGIPLTVVMPILAGIALLYTLISGLRASIVTDVVEMLAILVGIALIIPLAIGAAGGFGAVTGGFSGVTGEFGNIFNPMVAFSFGIVTSIGLISSTVIDQQQWQRVFALGRTQIRKAYIFGAFIFAIVPITLSFLGFLAASPELGIVITEGTDPGLIGAVTVAQLLAPWATFLFVLILISGISSTVDSAISATSSLWTTDVARKLKNAEERDTLRQSRFAMIGIMLLGLIVGYTAYFIPDFGIGQLFNLSISVAASLLVPTILTLYWDKISATGVFWGALIAIVIGMPTFIYANIVGNISLVAGASAFMVIISTLFCLIFRSK